MIDQYVTDHFPTAIAPKEAWPTMPADAYMGLPGEVMRTIEPHAESDLVAHLLQSLASFGSAVGRGPYRSKATGTSRCSTSCWPGDTGLGHLCRS
jgi:hypothetical protein